MLVVIRKGWGKKWFVYHANETIGKGYDSWSEALLMALDHAESCITL